MKSTHLFSRAFVAFAFAVVAANVWAGDNDVEMISDIPFGKIAFVSGRAFGSPGTISIIDQDTVSFKGRDPVFAASGKKLVFSNHDHGGSALFIRSLSNASNVSVEKIDNGLADTDSPSLSNSETMLTFVSWPAGRKSSHIYVCAADGSGSRQLTTGDHYNWSPRWSPDGTKILFESTRDGQRQIYVMDADGKNQTNLSNNKVLCHAPSWSSDGRHIAYMSHDEGKNASIFLMKNDGTEKKNISHSKTRDSEPAWSPDSEWIAFTRTAPMPPESEAMDIWIMKRDGTEQQQITRNKPGMSSYQPSWSR